MNNLRTIYIVHTDYIFSDEQTRDSLIIRYTEYAEKEPENSYEPDANDKKLRERQNDVPYYLQYIAGEAIKSRCNVYFAVDYAYERNKHEDASARSCVEAYENYDDEFIDDNDNYEIPHNINKDINYLHVLLKRYKKIIKISKELY